MLTTMMAMKTIIFLPLDGSNENDDDDNQQEYDIAYDDDGDENASRWE